jgi:transcriptional regulator with XRE-family HTH domain
VAPDWTLRPGALLRAVRHVRRLSQRELAENAEVQRSVIARIEAGTSMPRLDTFARLLDAAGHSLMIVNRDGTILEIDLERERLSDRGYRRLPAHLDVVPMTSKGPTGMEPLWWWGWFRIAWGPEFPTVPSHALVTRRVQRYRLHARPNWCDPDAPLDTVT